MAERRVECAECGTEFAGRNSRARFCSSPCRVKAHRRGTPATEAPSPGAAFERATLRELEKLGKVDTMLGQQALVIARRMGSATETGSAVSSLSKEHSRLMAAVATGATFADPVDEARQSRERKARALEEGSE